MSGDIIRTGTFYLYGGQEWLYPPPALIPQGWQCPVCKKVHAPHVRSCDCNEHETISNNTLPLFWVK